MLSKKHFIVTTIIVAALGAAVLILYVVWPNPIQEVKQTTSQWIDEMKNENPESDIITPNHTILSMPFISQAPTADWADPRQQDGCEEASLIMAHMWVTGTTLTPQQAEAEIIKMSEWQKEKYGQYVDRSITDTGIMFEEYYGHKDYEIRNNITAEDIIKELAADHLVIVPTSGQILDNPNYSGTGPITHMLPVIGYDKATGEFITHDPGTRRGKEYRYSFDTLINAIYDYKTGNHEGYEKTDTIMMVIEK